MWWTGVKSKTKGRERRERERKYLDVLLSCHIIMNSNITGVDLYLIS